MNKKVAFHHFGCKVNFAEASALSKQFHDKGYELSDFHDPADIYVISTCVVTAIAEKKCRAAIRQAHKLNPSARIAVIGCFSELKPGEIASMEGVDLVLGHTAKFDLLRELDKLDTSTPYHAGIPATEQPSESAFIPSFSSGDRTRSFLKIQDGCDYYCTYCTIPMARGRSRSDTIQNVLANARKIIDAGIREIVLTGVNIGDFGRQRNESFLDLIRALERVENIDRIRISSIEPDLLNNDIILHVAGSSKFLPHFHIPLQSGCNKTLKAMHRKYNRELYADRVEQIRKFLPQACIAADVIVGFPGETREDFEETFRFLRDLDISYLHVFSYSKRDNTLASKMANPVPDPEKRSRSEQLHHLSDEKKQAFYLRNAGSEERVLFESDNSNGFMHGFTRNYIRVKTVFNPGFVNQIIPVRLSTLGEDGVYVFIKG